MPVAVLLCEGENDSVDPKLLMQLLPALCEVRGEGGKHIVEKSVRALRRQRLVAAGIRDGDFVKEWQGGDQLREWRLPRDTEPLGWLWPRHEVENYLLDPVLVQAALGSIPEGYEAALLEARDTLAVYQAARAAVALTRPKTLGPIKSAWGHERGQRTHRLPLPERLTESACREDLEEQVRSYTEGQRIEVEKVNAEMDALLPEYLPGGIRYRDYLKAFSGKDLLYQLMSWLPSARHHGKKLNDTGKFMALLLQGIQERGVDLAALFPEWAELRQRVQDG